MAVDTETKRRSSLGMGITALMIAPVADGDIANVDRKHVTALYAGIVTSRWTEKVVAGATWTPESGASSTWTPVTDPTTEWS